MKKTTGRIVDSRKAEPHEERSLWNERVVLVVTCLLVIGVYAYTAQSGYVEWHSQSPADTYYNLLVQSFRAGQLSLKKEVPSGLAQLANPYDPQANAPYRCESCGMLDLSYYKGRLYLYFGVTPVLILFWPFAALTGHYLFHRHAVLIFCAIGFLVSVVLLRALWHRYFAKVSVGVVAACTLALGLATGLPVLLARCDIYEVAIACGYMLTMLALGAIWCALQEPERRGVRWLAAASLAYGLALGARPSLLFGAVILLMPAAYAWRQRRKSWALLMAAVGPITLIGLGLMLYNALRFDSPLEFGQRYQVNGSGQFERLEFSLRYLWFNLRGYFLDPTRWRRPFPFVHNIVLPAGHEDIEAPFGILTNIPLVWLALAVPLAWRSRPKRALPILRWYVAAVALLFGTCALTLCLHCSAWSRYEVDFLPALVLLAVIGILSLEHALAPTSESGQAGRTVWRLAARLGWAVLLFFSVIFNLLVSVTHCAEAHNDRGYVLYNQGRVSEAIAQYDQALRLKADYGEAHNNLGVALSGLNRVSEAIEHWQQAVQFAPDFAEAHNNLGIALLQQGKVADAVTQLDQALRINPGYVEAHNNMALALWQMGQRQEAVEHWEQALRLNPDQAKVHSNLGLALVQTGRVNDAIPHYEQALRLNPDSPEAQNNLGLALELAGRTEEAIAHFGQAVRLNPGFTPAQNNLARLRAAHK